MTIEAFDLEDDLFFFFENNVDTCSRGVVATTLFLSSATLKISLIVLVFLAALVLIGELPTMYVNKGKVSRLIYPKILSLDWFVPLETL